MYFTKLTAKLTCLPGKTGTAAGGLVKIMSMTPGVQNLELALLEEDDGLSSVVSSVSENDI